MSHPRRILCPLAASLLLAVCPAGVVSGAPALVVSLDARDAPRKILHAELTIPAQPGPQTLVYPKWLPGEHGPTGPIADLAGLRFNAGGQGLAWQRDGVDMYAFHLTVPPGATEIQASLDFLLPPTTAAFSSGASATSQLVIISWNQVVLYPAGAKTDDVACVARLRLPQGWSYASALVGQAREEGVEFERVSLTTLVDSPAVAGAHMRTIDLSPGAVPPHYLHLVGDSEASLDASPDLVAAYRKLVAETGALFGARHYRSYHFLCTLSDGVAHFGLEHHESSDDRTDERALLDDNLRKIGAGLLPHELVHSWNGKYRRPQGLATRDFQEPMKGDLLWVYEGLTEYLGDILAARSGLWTPDLYRQNLARVAAELDHGAGRAWRPLADTAVDAQALYEARKDWASLRRGTDFYDEGELIWLEADVTLRKQTGGRKSLDDFCRLFYGGASGPPSVVPYTLEDVVAALNALAPYDWAGFFAARVDRVNPRAPLGGIQGSGWRLVYTDTPNELERAHEQSERTLELTYSIGAVLKDDGTIVDVTPGLAAARADLGPGMKVVAVGGRRFTPQLLREALRSAKGGTPVALLVESDEYYTTHALDVTGGERHPHLDRDDAQPDVLSAILKPLTTSAGSPK